MTDTRIADLKAAGWTDDMISAAYTDYDPNTGTLGQNKSQIGSQYWLDGAYTGSEPDTATKALYTNATYARDWANSAMALLTGKQLYADVELNDVATKNVITQYTAAGRSSEIGYTAESSAASDLMDTLTGAAETGAEWVSNNLTTILMIVAGIVGIALFASAVRDGGTVRYARRRA